MPKDRAKIGIFGGTFNPIHCGHVKAAEIIQAQFNLDKVYFIPSFIPPHKKSIDIASPRHRLKMVELALAPYAQFLPSALEIEAKGKSYSIFTLEKMRKMCPDSQIFFLLGIDAFLEIETWKDYEQVLEQCSFIIMSRPGFHLEGVRSFLNEKYIHRMRDCLESPLPADPDLRQNLIYLVPIAAIDVSSTEIRNRVRVGQSIAGLVPESVERYIKEKGLYQKKMSEKIEIENTRRRLPKGVILSAKAAQAKKAEGIVILDLTTISSFTDFFIIMNGNSTRQNAAISDAVEEALKKEKIRPLSIEGKENAEWILMDYGDFIVHIFSERARHYYLLEKLWGDGIKIPL
jgi:nicotinate-nucleotide adenylyltransferase